MNLKPRRSRASIILWSLIALMAVFMVISTQVRREEPAAAVAPETEYAVQLLTVEPTPFPDLVRLPGRVAPDYRARLPSVKPGQVASIFAERGDAVTNGQLLLRLDARLWEAALAAAEVEQREAKQEFERWNDLVSAGAVSGSDMDRIRHRREKADILVDEARTHIEHCEVRSPVDGVINERFIEVGEYATEGMAVFEVVVNDPAKVVVEVPERDAGAVRIGGELPFTASILPGRVFTGTVAFAAAAAAEHNNAFRMELRADNREGLLKPGMIVEIDYPRGVVADGLSVPLDAILPRNGEHVLFVEKDGRAVRRTARIDRIAGASALLASGVSAGERVVVKGNRSLVDGALLKPVEDAPEGTAAP